MLLILLNVIYNQLRIIVVYEQAYASILVISFIYVETMS